MDKLLWNCAKLVVEMQSGSTSNLQRRLNIGYDDAGRAMDQLEHLGIVGAAAYESAPRRILVKTVDELNRFFDADFIAEAESPFTITKNDFYNSYDVTGGCLFWFTNNKKEILEKQQLFFLVNYEHNEFVLHVGCIGMHDFKKETVIHLQFHNNRILTYEIKFEAKNGPTKISIPFNDIIVLEKEVVKVVLVDFKKYNNKVQLYIDNETHNYEQSQSTLKELLKKVSELNPNYLKDSAKIEVDLTTECYVYLMIDLANNFYKIGLSNDLNIRESTLQSEKPTIEIIANKKFINRKIASVFEKTLHTVYQTKRIRGEWFNLDSSELNEVIITLKS